MPLDTPATKKDSLWYRVSDMPPPFNVHVKLQVDGREFKGARGKDRLGKVVWVEYRRHEMVPVHHLNFAYALWQPLYPDKWQADLPKPVEVVEAGRMYSERSRFQAVEDASSEELALEMHRDRETARVSERSTRQPHWNRQGQAMAWWWDVTAIRYEAPPGISLKMAEGRVMRALAWCGHGQGVLPPARASAVMLATAIEAHAASEAPPAEVRAVRFQPLPSDHSDFEVAMGWFAALNPVELRPRHVVPWSLSSEQLLMLSRASPNPMSFAEIGAKWAGIGKGRSMKEADWNRKPVSREAARQRFERAVEKCWRSANGMRVHTQLEAADQIKALRERNRKWRSRA